jgi:hypothetical protein
MNNLIHKCDTDRRTNASGSPYTMSVRGIGGITKFFGV